MKSKKLNSINFIKKFYKDIQQEEKLLDKSITIFDKEWISWEQKQKMKWKPRKKNET